MTGSSPSCIWPNTMVVGMSIIQLCTKLSDVHAVLHKGEKWGNWQKSTEKCRYIMHTFRANFSIAGNVTPFSTHYPIQHTAAALWPWGLLNANTRACTTSHWNPVFFVPSSTIPMFSHPLNGTVLLSTSLCSAALLRLDPSHHLKGEFPAVCKLSQTPSSVSVAWEACSAVGATNTMDTQASNLEDDIPVKWARWLWEFLSGSAVATCIVCLQFNLHFSKKLLLQSFHMLQADQRHLELKAHTQSF